VFEPALDAVLEGGHTARFVARGDSMHPAIHDGEAVYVERPASPLLVGDVVLAQATRGLTAHRIIRLARHRGAIEIVTRGDNCFWNDPPLTTDDLVGRVVSVERNGRQIRLFDRPLTRIRLLLRTFIHWITMTRQFGE
jgi:Peptidase S24-like